MSLHDLSKMAFGCLFCDVCFVHRGTGCLCANGRTSEISSFIVQAIWLSNPLLPIVSLRSMSLGVYVCAMW